MKGEKQPPERMKACVERQKRTYTNEGGVSGTDSRQCQTPEREVRDTSQPAQGLESGWEERKQAQNVYLLLSPELWLGREEERGD